MTQDEKKARYKAYHEQARTEVQSDPRLSVSRCPAVQAVEGGAFVEVQMFIPEADIRDRAEADMRDKVNGVLAHAR